MYNLIMKARIGFSRLLIAVVVFFNLQAALAFLIDPGKYAPGFELSGVAGEALVRGMGILFIMWNVPYLVALTHPVQHRLSLFEAIAMQAIGVMGESILLATLPEGHPALVMTALRFIAFDLGGLGLLILAAILTMRKYLPAGESDR
jgi:hypothetical protein